MKRIKLIKKYLKEAINNQRIICEKCGWSWDLADGGDDPYICHKCNHDNSKKYATEKV